MHMTLGARPRRQLAQLLAIGVAAGSLLALGEAPAKAADACQHSTHKHYHFPYAHYDTHTYKGLSNSYDTHTHFYRNENHSDNYSKSCGDPH